MSQYAAKIACNTSRNSTAAIVVLGIGNVLWADEGFGVRCVELLQQRYEFGPNVELIDGGTQGLYLIHHVQGAACLMIFDAIDYGLAPGTIQVIENEDVPKYLGAKKMSLHQTGFQEVLALAQLTGRYPRQVVLIGCQPDTLEDYGGSLRPSVRAAIEPALQVALRRLSVWGAEPQLRTTPLGEGEAVTLPNLAMGRYEGGRPSEEQACRVGDDRFMPTTRISR
jgi:hydrogenase maturation protease